MIVCGGGGGLWYGGAGMALYFVNYDLRQERDYQALYDALEALGAVRLLESVWCFNQDNTTATAMRNHFRKILDLDDGLLVSEVSEWATRKTMASPYDLRAGGRADGDCGG